MSNKTISYTEIEENQLRDHFAGLALKSLIETKNFKNSVGQYNATALAIKSYEIADAMVKVRKENSKSNNL